MITIEDDFFFPANVHADYTIFGLGPRHLRRVFAGLVPAAFAVLLLSRYVIPFVWALGIVALLLGIYVAAWAYPSFGEESLVDVWLQLRSARLHQTKFDYGEVVNDDVQSSDREVQEEPEACGTPERTGVAL